eukprot:m.541276 g.541276  ORF g.541276 m.541276 type:complete len:1085 (-) comp22107_c0_seq2:532-3786(-)
MKDRRNVAVIAHVDHGKTTLSDALLHRAGVLSADKAGDQNRGRELDTSKEERERGITIKATGITLEYQLRSELMLRGDTESKARIHATEQLQPSMETRNDTLKGADTDDDSSSDTDANDFELYVGNLPRTTDTTAVLRFLQSLVDVPKDAAVGINLNSRRHFAFVSLPVNVGRNILAVASDEAKCMLDGRKVLVRARGTSSVKRLGTLLSEEKHAQPVYTVVDGGTHNGTPSWTGRLVVDGIGLVACTAAESQHMTTRKEVKEALACKFLKFLETRWKSDDITDAPVADVTVAATTTTVPARDAHCGAPRGDNGEVPTERQLGLTLIDCPGHVDFSAEVTSALRMTDGALVVVDVVEGKSAQTETVLLQAMQERVKPVLMLNKCDRLLLEMQLSAEQVFDRFENVIAEINAMIAAHQDPHLPDQRVSLANGSVAFGSGYFQWAATVDSFVDVFKPGCTVAERAKLRQRLCRRDRFATHVLGPIYRIHRDLGLIPGDGDTAVVDPTPAFLTTWLSKFNQKLAGMSQRRLIAHVDDVATRRPRKVLKTVLAHFLPAADALLEMMVVHLPSPVEAQAYRASILYRNRDATFHSIATCDTAAPLMLSIAKMVQPSETSKRHGGLLAIGRVFAGTVRSGDVVRVAGTVTQPRGGIKVGQVLQCVGRHMEALGCAYAGQIVAISGVSAHLRKSGTLTTSPTAIPINEMKFSVSPVVLKSIRPKDSRQLKKMVTAMRQIAQADQTAQFYQDEETKEHVLAGAGELHLEVLLHSLEDEHGVVIVESDPMVSYRETVTSASTAAALKKSSNKLNRLWFKASPLAPGLVEALASPNVDPNDFKALGKLLVDEYAWDKQSAQRLWAVGPEPLAAGADDDDSSGAFTCMLVNSTTGLQIPSDAKDTIIEAFRRVTREGVLARAMLRGVRFDLVDAKFHQDSNHRSAAQLDPAAKSAMRGAFMLAQPTLVEPLFRVEVRGPAGTINGAYGELTGPRRGRIVDDADIADTYNSGSGFDTITAELPVRLSFGLADGLRGITSGKAFMTTAFGGWQSVPGAPDTTAEEGGGEARQLVEAARTAKRIVGAVPTSADFIDRM